MPPTDIIDLKEGRFARLEAIEWWDQALLARTRVLVIGAGALGNEVIKNLALLGVGRIVVIDMDRVELSNLSRSVLFRAEDEGRPKAECAAEAARGIFAGVQIVPVTGNVLADLGLGCFRWADVVLGALDNREARVFVNAACARVGRPWFDGGIEVLHGVARGFAPPATACYECTMSEVDWQLLNKRRSCSLVARRAAVERGTPTTPTTASIIAAIQVQEMVKHVHGRPALLGRGFLFDGAGHSSYSVQYTILPGCPWHEPPAPVESVPRFGAETRLGEIWEWAGRRLGGVDALEFARELAERLDCPGCGAQRPLLRQVDLVRADDLVCATCGGECAPVFLHSVQAGSPLLPRRVREIGLPRWDILWARRGNDILGIELAADRLWPDGSGSGGN